MKNIFLPILLCLSWKANAQMQTYTMEKKVTYRLSSDFYSNYVHLFSTKNDSTTLMIIATPMGNNAILYIGKKFYPVYSENGKQFKLDTEEALQQNKYKPDSTPSIELPNMKSDIRYRPTNQTEKIHDKDYPLFNVISRDGMDTSQMVIDTASIFNTVPFLAPSLNNKGLIYQLGNSLTLERYEMEDLIWNRDDDKKEDRDDDDDHISDKKENLKTETPIIQFDLQAAIADYRKALWEKKNKPKSSTPKKTSRH